MRKACGVWASQRRSRFTVLETKTLPLPLLACGEGVSGGALDRVGDGDRAQGGAGLNGAVEGGVDEVRGDKGTRGVVDEDVVAVCEGVESVGDGVTAPRTSEDDVGVRRDLGCQGANRGFVGWRHDDGEGFDARVGGEQRRSSGR